MKSKLKLVPTDGMSREEWLSYRHRGLGASEVGTVLGLDDYTSSLELFYYKIGDVFKFNTESMASFMGREQEDLIARMWTHWDGKEDTMIQNWRAGTIIRKCQRVNSFVHNPDYPWLYVSLDRKINKHTTPQGILKGEGSLELKTINIREADKWESGLPPKYITQVTTQIGVCEFDYGEMAILQDARKFFVLPFSMSPNIWNHIITRTKVFWDKVLEARKLVNEKYICLTEFNHRRVAELDHEIDKLAPEPDGTLVYADYLSQKYKRPLSAERKGTEAELQAAIAQRDAADRLKEIQEQKLLQENILKRSMADKIQLLDFGERGRVYWSVASNGSRIFRNKIIRAC